MRVSFLNIDRPIILDDSATYNTAPKLARHGLSCQFGETNAWAQSRIVEMILAGIRRITV